MRKHYSELVKYPDVLSDHLNRLAVLYCYSGNVALARKRFLTSLKVKPLQIFAYKRVFPLFFFPDFWCRFLQAKVAKKASSGIFEYW